jgi:hypothetical protein
MEAAADERLVVREKSPDAGKDGYWPEKQRPTRR